jgi:hypothetical protein
VAVLFMAIQKQFFPQRKQVVDRRLVAALGPLAELVELVAPECVLLHGGVLISQKFGTLG